VGEIRLHERASFGHAQFRGGGFHDSNHRELLPGRTAGSPVTATPRGRDKENTTLL
jgi:hypothetical protein